MDSPQHAAISIEWPMSGLSGKEGCLVYYQPKVDLLGGGAVGGEALVRWQDKAGRILTPAEFLPLFGGEEEVRALDLFVLKTVVHQVTMWNKRGIRPIVSVNMSPGHFSDEHFAQNVIQILKETPEFDPSHLAIEILESVAINDFHTARRSMISLRNHGIKFYLDDFGTGHSSPAYLKQLPIDAIKIDQLFCRDLTFSKSGLEDRSIIEATIAIAEAFGITVIAEGVESEATAKELVGMGVQTAQGFHFARPMPANEFYAWYTINQSSAQYLSRKI